MSTNRIELLRAKLAGDPASSRAGMEGVSIVSGATLESQAHPFSGLSSGVRRGALTQFYGPDGGGKTSAAVSFLAENPSLRCAWIESELTIYPPALSQRGVDLARVLFVEEPARARLFGTLTQVLTSGCVDVLIWSDREVQSETALRRLQIAARRAQVSVILINESPIEAGRWTLADRLECTRDRASGSDLRVQARMA